MKNIKRVTPQKYPIVIEAVSRCHFIVIARRHGVPTKQSLLRRLLRHSLRSWLAMTEFVYYETVAMTVLKEA
jgi:hypothetical protein